MGNQIFDVAGRTQSPYILNHSFAAVPVLAESKYNNQIKLGYTPLFYSNTGNTIAAVQVNFLAGAGYQNIYANGTVTPVTKIYSDSSGFKKFAIKVIYSNGSIDECYTGQTVKVVLPPAGNTANRYDILLPQEILNPTFSVVPVSYSNINPVIPVLWSNNYPNAPFTQNLVRLQQFNQNMKIYVRYSKKRIGTALANKIVKPFIVVEGYDITDASQLLKPNNYNINSLIGEWNSLTAKYDFNKKLDEEAGYDLIFIDYYTMRSITENADYLLQAIDWINSQKENNAAGVREQNVVMGISMGGLVSRYALAKRTKLTGTNSTETRQLLTMDSPHQGANVPLGLQHFLYDFGEARIVKKIGDISDELKAFYNLNTLPATQQQLILRATDGNGGRANNTFLVDGGPYRTMIDYNAPYLFYAISNGSQCAVPVMQPGTLLLKKEGNVASANWLLFFYNNKYRLNIQVNALPTYGTDAQICSVVMERNIRLFWGAIGTGWKTTSNTSPRISPPNTIPWDGVPGGTKSTETTGPISQTSTTPAMNQNNTFLGNAWRSLLFLLFNVNANIQLPFSQKEFSFVPITSALDVQNVTASTFSQPFNFTSNGLLGSRANKYITQEKAAGLFNIEHTNFTPRNALWIYNEMENLQQPPLNCNDYCSSVEGPASLCNPSAYTLSGLAPNSTVIWSAAPADIVQLSCTNCLQTTLTIVGSGTITLTATITNACGTATVSKQIIVNGSPDVSPTGIFTTTNFSGYLQSINCLKTYTHPGMYSGTVDLYPGYPYTWTLLSKNPSTAIVSLSATSTPNQVAVTVKPKDASATYRLTSANACGSYYRDYVFMADCTPAIEIERSEDELSVAPNPVNTTFVLSLKSEKNTHVIKEVVIKNKNGKELKRTKFNNMSKMQTINIQNLPVDVYIVEAFNGVKWLSIKIIKQ